MPQGRPMTVLFVMRHSAYVRNFESTLRMLGDRGHRVHLAFQRKVKYPQLDPTDIARQLSETYPTFSWDHMQPHAGAWGLVGRELRLGLDYLRYLTPEYSSAPKLRARAQRKAPQFVLDRTAEGLFATRPGCAALTATLRAMNRALPCDPAITAFLREARPDVLAVTPLIEPGSPQSEYVRSARALGIRTAYCVASWDNLTNKGLIHGPVDLVLVWNEAMKREAIELHGIPPDRVVVTGAAAFDHWFDWRSSDPPEVFRARVGLPPDRPYLLYLCSSKFVTPQEVPFVRRWLEQIRRSAVLRDVGVLIRPHPQHTEQWEGVSLEGFGPVVVWPPAGTAPVDTATRGDYFDSMYHSAAVVGVNTTAIIESAIVGRRVYTVLAPEFRDTQEGTLHFHHLLEGGGGPLHVARDLDEHVAHLDAAVRDAGADKQRLHGFVKTFVRPYGLDVPATPRFVAALEELASRGAARREREPWWAPLVRRRLEPLRARLEREKQAPLEKKAAKRAARAARESRRAAREAERHARLAEKARREEERRAQKPELDRLAGQERVDALAAEFRALGEVKRRNFLTAVRETIPATSLIELHAATPPQKLDYEGADIYLRVTTKGETFRLRACAKEPFTIDWIHTWVGAGDVLYDIGANVGVYSLVAAKKPSGGARTFAFEAGYATVASLCANIVLNDVAHLITPVPVALSDATAMNVFSLRDLEPGAARHALGYEEPEDGPTLYQQPVLMFRLDDLVEWFRLPPPNHIKLDVDGGELGVLNGAARTLTAPTLRSILVEVATALSGDVTTVLTQHGFQLHSKTVVKSKSGEYAVWYGLFMRGGDTCPQPSPDHQDRSISR